MTTDKQLRVLIVGASVAGPAAAYWFAKAGARVTVIERYSELRTNGQNIDIRTIGVTVMQKMPGMEAAVRAKAVPMDGISIVNAHSLPFAVIGATGNPDQQSLVSEYEILRGDLSQIMFDMTDPNPNITYVFDEQIASLSSPGDRNNKDNTPGPVTVTFANNHLPPQQYDLVVAADGATSRTRALGLDCPVREHMRPLHSWAAYFCIPDDLLAGSRIGQGFNAPGGLMIGIGPHAQPGTNQITIMRRYPAPDDSGTEGNDPMLPFRAAQKAGTDALRTFVAREIAGKGWKCAAVARSLLAPSSAHDFYASEIAQVRAPRLARGRVALVGDAGYAAGQTGFGTSLALAGAYVLAGEVGKHKGDLEAALRGYEAVMAPLVAEGQAVPAFVHTVMMPQTWWGLWVRNWVLWFLWRTGLLGVGQWLSAGAFGKREEGGLPEYEWVA